MPYMAPSKIMMLGRLQPQARTGYLNPPRTSPQVPQNLLRQTLLGGLGSTGRMLSGLGQVVGSSENPIGDVTTESAIVANDALANPTLPGQAVPTTAAPVMGGNGDGGYVTPVQYPSIGAQAGVNVFGQRLGLGATLGFASVSLLSGALSAIHGWNRDKTPIAAWGWFTLGSLFPIVTPLVALGQGYAKPRRRGR